MTPFPPRARLALIFLLALLARLGYVAARGAPGAPEGDALEYHRYAVSVLEKGRYEAPDGSRATRMPGYPLFLASLYALFGPSPEAAIRAQCVLGAGTCLLLYALAGALLPAPWALACALFACVYRGLAEPCSLLLSECLYSFLLAAGAACLYAVRSSARRAVGFSAALACAYLVRPEPLPYALLCAVLLPRLLPGMKARHALLALAVLGGTTLAWTLRNARVLHVFLPGSSASNFVGYLTLYLPLEAQGVPVGPRHEPDAGLGELERDRGYGEALKRLKGSVGLGLRIKSRLFNLAAVLYPFLPSYDVTFMLLAPFFALGLGLAARRPELWPLAAPVPMSCAVFMFFGGPASRYRQGFAPFLIVLAFWGLWRLREKRPALAWRAAAAWAGANALVWALGLYGRGLALGAKAFFWG